MAATEAAAVEAEAATALQACVRGRRSRLEMRLEVRWAEESEEVRTPSLRHARGFRQALRLTHVASAVGAAAMRIVEYDGDADGPYGEQGVRQEELFKALSGAGAARGVTTTGQRAEAAEGEQRLLGGETVVAKRRVAQRGWPSQWCFSWLRRVA